MRVRKTSKIKDDTLDLRHLDWMGIEMWIKDLPDNVIMEKKHGKIKKVLVNTKEYQTYLRQLIVDKAIKWFEDAKTS